MDLSKPVRVKARRGMVIRRLAGSTVLCLELYRMVN